MTEERLLEIGDDKNPDLQAFLFCSAILIDEDKDNRPHVTGLFIDGGLVYSNNGFTARKAKLSGEYPPGVYRVFRAKKKHAILYLSDSTEYPESITGVFDIDGLESLGDISFFDGHYVGHAAAIYAIRGEHAYNAKYLEKVEGVYELYQRDKYLILDSDGFSVALAPLQVQVQLPGAK